MTLEELNARLTERAKVNPEESYTAKLVAAGISRAAKKLGEEAVETVIAAVSGNRGELVTESADLIYHLIVTLIAAGVPLAEVMDELERRTAQSGLAEKASRTRDLP
jgi:phosphoribosyl-ATP pyrophosphohydrolase